jgi:hypothetical protein
MWNLVVDILEMQHMRVLDAWGAQQTNNPVRHGLTPVQSIYIYV